MFWLAALALVVFEALALAAAAVIAHIRLTLRPGAFALLALSPAPLGALVLAPRLAAGHAVMLDLACAALALAAGAILTGYVLRWLKPQSGARVWRFAWVVAIGNALLLGALWYAQAALWRLPEA